MDTKQQKYREALEVIGHLQAAGFDGMLAGGCVRDRILGIDPQDYDVATNAAPDQVAKIAAQVKIKVVPTGFEHGTMTLVMPHGPVEVTTLRIDLETYGRHATVTLGTDFKGDAARRDFTMNAMFEDRSGGIHDFYNGQADIRAKTLRFVGDPATRIQEDYLRIMRLFRFWARFDFTPAPGTLDAVAAQREGLLQISQERITSELRKILICSIAPKILRAMVDCGVLPMILQELAPYNLPADTIWKPLQKIEEPSNRAVAALSLLCFMNGCHSSERVKELALRLRLSRAETRRISFLVALPVRLPEADGPQSAFMDVLDQSDDTFQSGASWITVGRFYAESLATLAPNLSARLARVTQIEEKKSHLRKAESPISVPEIMQMFSLSPGPEVGRIALDLRSAYRNEVWFSKPDGVTWLLKLKRS